MHDPMTVAFEVHNPFPRRNRFRDSRPGQKRWTLGRRMFVNKEHVGQAVHPWWQPRAWEPRIAGRAFGMRSFITVWHVEPDGHDSGEVCKHYIRWQDDTGEWRTKNLRGWRYHAHHWHLQVAPLQDLRRALFQRCAWCAGRSTRANTVDVSHSWDGPRAKHWWQSNPGMYHGRCSAAYNVDRSCLCEVPIVEKFNGAYGVCATCGKYYRGEATWTAHRLAVEASGIPERGRAWTWPAEVNVREIDDRLKADRGA